MTRGRFVVAREEMVLHNGTDSSEAASYQTEKVRDNGAPYP
jgi:hypothetical protein